MDMAYRPSEIAEVSQKLVAFMETLPNDIGVKIAACRSAASVLESAVASQSLAAVVNNLLNGGR